MPDPVTVIIVDDHEMVRKGARGYLDAQLDITVVAEAESGSGGMVLTSDQWSLIGCLLIYEPRGTTGARLRQSISHASPEIASQKALSRN
jgi:DNA-binding NarL/FixJ family response regulator